MNEIVVVTFYKFATLDDYQEMQPKLKAFCVEQGIYGSILLALEGINATVAGEREGIEAVLAYLRADPRLADMTHKESFADFIPFNRMKVRLKKEIVKIGLPDVDPNDGVGTYVPAQDWNALISDPEVILIDTRNDFEYKVGTFRGAVNPETESFGEFPAYVSENLDPNKHKKVAMFCTGGIRCEKATAYLLKQGFENVYHLKDGILKYLEVMSSDESLWDGECFVFDKRVTLTHALKPGNYDLCLFCYLPLSDEDKVSPYYEEGVYCPHCYHSLTEGQIARAQERKRQRLLAEARETA